LWGGGEFDKLFIVGVGEILTNWSLLALWRVWQTGYCGRGEEFDKQVIVGVGQILTNWLLWVWGRV
jgi:hypothetical protein